MINYKLIFRVLGLLLVVEAFFMFVTAGVALFYKEPDITSHIKAAIITGGTGIIFGILGRHAGKKIGKREGYIIVSLVWIVFSFFGLLPFYIGGYIPSFTDSFFETMSGFTTTGSSILNDIEALPHGILFWRSIIQWLGGMGIIVLSLAVLPFLGVGGMQLFAAEVPGPTPDKLHPKITSTAKRLWGIYLALTIAETVLLAFGGMDVFDSVCHSFTTMATGGYSTKQASIAYWESPYIQYVITLFMFLAGTNFTLTYFAIKLKPKKVFKNEEFRFYLGFVILFTLVIGAGLMYKHGLGLERAFRDSLFQVVSIITTTGYATADYLTWFPLLSILIFILMFFGGSAGSTGGGIKIVRIVMLIKNSSYELKRLIHPNAIIPARYNSRVVAPEIVTNVLAFFVFYVISIIVSIVVLSALGIDFETSVGAVVTCIGNIGPGIGDVGPAANFAYIPDFGKWYLSFLMLLGRLELFTIIVMFSAAFWKK
ncbi:TrkH family potassium uptake protein [Saccharicrinis sp. FJH2]|uniref:TrkH family potassium uptake protein n=1 Tax=unclassified Saccharicrinis TaxID=2646859 RepID=UPI0035D3ECC8